MQRINMVAETEIQERGNHRGTWHWHVDDNEKASTFASVLVTKWRKKGSRLIDIFRRSVASQYSRVTFPLPLAYSLHYMTCVIRWLCFSHTQRSYKKIGGIPDVYMLSALDRGKLNGIADVYE